jgi:hypothetical protein
MQSSSTSARSREPLELASDRAWSYEAGDLEEATAGSGQSFIVYGQVKQLERATHLFGHPIIKDTKALE